MDKNRVDYKLLDKWFQQNDIGRNVIGRNVFG